MFLHRLLQARQVDHMGSTICEQVSAWGSNPSSKNFQKYLKNLVTTFDGRHLNRATEKLYPQTFIINWFLFGQSISLGQSEHWATGEEESRGKAKILSTFLWQR